MTRDPRGGHNRKPVNEDFFKTWSPQMAYVLGLVLADGAIENVQKSSRTCYLQITSKDKPLLEDVKQVLSSKHRLYVNKSRLIKIRGKIFHASKSYNLRIGNKIIYADLYNLGIVSKKASRINLPQIPDSYFRFFIRGYFDGDGCVNIYHPKIYKKPRISVIFTSCCQSFLYHISIKLSEFLDIGQHRVYLQYFAFRLSYRGKEALKILEYIYSNLAAAPYLDRKYKIYTSYL